MTNFEDVIENIDKFKEINKLNDKETENGLIYARLKCEEHNYGFMIFSKEEYNKSKIEKFSKTSKKHFEKYPQHHRFYFYEKLNGDKNNIIFILYNPSYATPEVNDPTINNCIKLANENNFSTIEILNIYSERNPNIKNLEDENNDLNIQFINQLLNKRETSIIVLAWGNKYIPKELEEHIISNYNQEQQKNIKIITAQKPEAKIQIRHPGNQGWSRLGGFKYAQLTSINDTNKTLKDLIQVKK